MTYRRTVKELLDALTNYPDNAWWYAYEGEVNGVGIRDELGGFLGFIEGNWDTSDDDQETFEAKIKAARKAWKDSQNQ